MSASINDNGCFIWEGKVGISTSGDPSLDLLTAGKIGYTPQSGKFVIYVGRGRNEKQVASFALIDVHNISLNGSKKTACRFEISTPFDIQIYSVIEFTGARDSKNLLTATEKAQSFSEFLFRLAAGAKESVAFNVVKASPLAGSKPPLLRKRPNAGYATVVNFNVPLPTEQNNQQEIRSVTRSQKMIEMVNNQKDEDEYFANVKYARMQDNSVSVPSMYDSLRSKSSYYNNNGATPGLTNMGNTCYFNAVLQATFIIDALSKRLFESLKFFQKEALNPEFFVERYTPLMKALSNLMVNRIKGANLSAFLDSVFQCVRNFADKFHNNRQEDAHEFLTDMLSQLQSEFNEAVRQLNGRRPSILKSSDPIHECFGYVIRRTFRCLACTHESTVEEVSTSFIVHCSEERLKSRGFTFADTIRDSMAVEFLDHVCERCKHKKATVKPEFVLLPEHFIFVIRRYFYNQNTRNKQKLHVKVAMHKYLTFVTTTDIPQLVPVDDQLRYAKSETKIRASQQKKTKKSESNGCIDNRWRDRKVNTAKMGYLINELSEQEQLEATFFNLVENCKDYVIKEKATPCKNYDAEVAEIFEKFAYVLTGGCESLYAKLREIIFACLLKNADVFCELMKKSEKSFRDFIKKYQKTESPAINIELIGFASLFQTTLIICDKGSWTSYSPKYTFSNGERRSVAGRSAILKNKLYLPPNINYLASAMHPKRTKSYSLSSVVCHVGQTTEGGHYKCAVQTSNGSWSMCNDAVVNNCQEKTVLDKSSDSGYILIYTACKDRSLSPKREKIEDTRKS